MSLAEFWSNVRTSARFVSPRATVDSPRLDAGAIESALRRSTLWLTPGAVAGFDAADFDFLPDDDRAELGRLVTEFRRTAARVPATGPVTDEQVAAALPVFRDIVGRLAFDRYGDPEAYRVGHRIEQAIAGPRPPELVELRFDTGTDSTADPAVWVWAFLADESDEDFLRRAHSVRPLLDRAARAAAPDRLPYISFRSIGEQAELAEVGAA